MVAFQVFPHLQKQLIGRLSLEFPEGPDATVGVESDLFQRLAEKCGKEQGGIELGVGYDAKSDSPLLQGAQAFEHSGHRPDRVDPALVLNRQLAGRFDVEGRRFEHPEPPQFFDYLLPDLLDIDFGMFDSSSLAGGMPAKNFALKRILADHASLFQISPAVRGGQRLRHCIRCIGGGRRPDISGTRNKERTIDVEQDGLDGFETVQARLHLRGQRFHRTASLAHNLFQRFHAGHGLANALPCQVPNE